MLHTDHRCQMIDRLALVYELRREIRIEDVSFDEAKVRVLQVVLDISRLAQGEIVQDHNLFSLGQKSIDQMRTYVARTSGNECSHFRQAGGLSVDSMIS